MTDYFLGGGSSAIVLRLASKALTASLDLTGITIAASPGRWGANVSVTIVDPTDTDVETKLAADGEGVAAEDLFHLTLTETKPDGSTTQETYPWVTVVDGPQRVDLATRGSRLATVALGATPAVPVAGTKSLTFSATTDPDGAALGRDDYLGGSGDTFASDNKGLYGLNTVDLFTLLCLPPGKQSNPRAGAAVGDNGLRQWAPLRQYRW